MDAATQMTLITILLAANTSILGFAAKLLFSRLDHSEKSISHAHQRLDEHIRQSHCVN